MNILIIDDAEDIRLLLKKTLTSAGYNNLFMADSAKEGFKFLGINGNKLVSEEIPACDLVLMDILMNDMDGIEACRKIKEISYYKDLPVIMVTAKNEVGSLNDAFNAGAIDYITKPLKKVELLARVRSALRLKKETDSRKEQERILASRNKELEQALEEISTLRGLIPICAHCKMVRNNKGYWQQVEVYVSERSEATFSHGICEGCAKEHFQVDLSEKNR